MTTSSKITPAAPPAPEELRLHLSDGASADQPDGAWWPRSRDLQREAAALVDHFPAASGRISRMLFSRPDWDNSSTDGRGVRSIHAARGRVKVGSFPRDDTHLMVLTMSSGRRLRLVVIPSDTPEHEARVQLGDRAPATSSHDRTTAGERANDPDRRDDDGPDA